MDSKQSFLILVLVLVSVSSSALSVSALEEPYVILSFLSYEPLRSLPGAFVTIDLTIRNPTDETITLDRVEYTAFVDQVQVVPSPLTKGIYEEKIDILPSEEKIITIEFAVDLRTVESSVVDRVLTGYAILEVTGVAYFKTSIGILEAPFREYTPTSRIEIEVVDEDWKPLNNANVTLVSKTPPPGGWPNSFSKITDELGIAEFEVPIAKYTLRVTKEGFQPHEEYIDLSKPFVGGKTIQLTELKIAWWQQYWYLIAGILIVCIAVPLFLKARKPKT